MMQKDSAHGGVREFEGEANGITFKVRYDEHGRGTLVSAHDASGDPYILSQDQIDVLIQIADTIVKSGGTA